MTSNMWYCMVAALAIRTGLLYYGSWQDENMKVKYTDIDYHVFTDAAKYVTEGKSPYDRDTYRYTPLLAVLLTPNIYLSALFGKWMFIVCDVLVGYLIYRILKYQLHSDALCTTCACLWLFNPLPATVSSRGNAESIVAAMVLNTLFLLQRRQNKLAACVYGAAVHMKIYPVVYALPIYFFLEESDEKKSSGHQNRLGIGLLKPTWKRLQFVFISVSVFSLLGALCYLRYGDEFLHETYLYHITRRDVRHNFSVYFYMLYLTAETGFSSLVGLAAFLPQVVLMLVFSCLHYKDLPYCFFLNTFVFVTFNKVVTSQYFLWYLSLLPLVVPSLRRLGTVKTVVMAICWFLAQALWLSVAYKLEFQGEDVFFQLWLCSVLFFVVNIIVLFMITRHYKNSTFIGKHDKSS